MFPALNFWLHALTQNSSKIKIEEEKQNYKNMTIQTSISQQKK